MSRRRIALTLGAPGIKILEMVEVEICFGSKHTVLVLKQYASDTAYLAWTLASYHFLGLVDLALEHLLGILQNIGTHLNIFNFKR